MWMKVRGSVDPRVLELAETSFCVTMFYRSGVLMMGRKYNLQKKTRLFERIATLFRSTRTSDIRVVIVRHNIQQLFCTHVEYYTLIGDLFLPLVRIVHRQVDAQQ
jgi:hypothetical protein